ncbi:hypothetical protein IW261DRAFT_663560 [Armillaria novae-zelandiae]|uniref:Uncharacterized protein n=1 Tax=Armillaria novae-zelandiae TaxID=153914 RepID=A0AA39NXZ2_9AGAR|nr:hypothetical protein IW261DRAFT_663560 [Armillaria novae-zelandiae]
MATCSTSSHRMSQIDGAISTAVNRVRFSLQDIDPVVDAVGAEKTGYRFSSGFLARHDNEGPQTGLHLVSQMKGRFTDFA